MRLTPATELEYRCHKLQQLMAKAELDAVIILRNANQFYFTGTVQDASLYVPAIGQPLYIIRNNFMRGRMESGLRDLIKLETGVTLPHILAHGGYNNPKRIGMELDHIPANIFKNYSDLFPQSNIENVSPLISQIRANKSHYEIHLLQDAADQADKLFKYAHKVIRPGISDLAAAAELESYARKEGHQSFIRTGLWNIERTSVTVLSGVDGATPSFSNSIPGGLGVNTSFGQGSSFNLIEPNKPICLTFTASIDGYLLQQSRIFSIGTLPDLFYKQYEALLHIQNTIISSVKAGNKFSDLYKKAMTMAETSGYTDIFINNNELNIGHGIGIEYMEPPFLTSDFDQKMFETGMTLTLSPRITTPGLGALSLENTYYLSNEGVKKFNRTADDIIVLKNL